MPPKKRAGQGDPQDPLVTEARRLQTERAKGYRVRALKLYPPICAHCGREFSGKRLRELTVHHKDHDHENNPPDGSNWELLCLYCHDNEHARNQVASAYSGSPSAQRDEPPLSSKPFADLAELLKRKG